MIDRAAAGRARLPRSRDFTLSPLLVFYELTRACDLVCQHCRACAQSLPDPHELCPADSLRLIDQLTEFPTPPMVVLTGGDPFKRPDIFDLVEYASGKGLEVSVTPSATPLVTCQAIRRLADAGGSRLAVSIDGADAATHDAIRGVSGSFQRSLQILSDARTAGIPTQVNTTLTPAILPQLDDLAVLLAGQSIAMWSVFFLIPVGRAAAAERLSAEQCEQAFERLWHHSQQQRYAIKTTEAPHYRRYVAERRRQFVFGRLRSPTSAVNNRSGSPPTYRPWGVNDGKGVMFVGHTGQIFPSGFMPIVCGVFPGDHLCDVYQHSPMFLGLRDANQLEGKCGACEYRRLCGGSRARSYALTGNPFAEEPDCVYVPASRLRTDVTR